MADNDEYHFTDPDIVGPESSNETTPPPEQPSGGRAEFFKTHAQLIRNAAIVVSFVILCMLMYTIVVKISTHRKNEIKSVVPAAPVTTVQAPPVVPTPPPVMPSSPTIPAVAVDQKMVDLSQSQESMKADVLMMKTQLSDLDNNVNNLATKMVELNQQLEKITTHLDAQASEFDKLLHPPVRKVKHVKTRKVCVVPLMKYYVEAIMPGRAWLIAENGATLTVRRGSVIPGYGTVRSIDDRQGCIRTSNRALICFSQDDS
jgi:intracellular multiplication protein IcmG